jgi:hypothetical protein
MEKESSSLGALGDFLGNEDVLKRILTMGAGGLAGAGVGNMLTSKRRRGEDPAARRKRLMKNMLTTGLLGAGTVGAGSYALDQLGQATGGGENAGSLLGSIAGTIAGGATNPLGLGAGLGIGKWMQEKKQRPAIFDKLFAQGGNLTGKYKDLKYDGFKSQSNDVKSMLIQKLFGKPGMVDKSSINNIVKELDALGIDRDLYRNKIDANAISAEPKFNFKDPKNLLGGGNRAALKHFGAKNKLPLLAMLAGGVGTEALGGLL